MKVTSFLAMAAVLALAACSPKPTPGEVTASQSSESAAMSMTAAEAASVAAMQADSSSSLGEVYTGKWTGPEGTSLTITPVGKAFDVVIQNLDGPRTFSGTLKDDGLHITRDTIPLVIHKGSGQETGMKWLADKSDCVIIAPNEGYCRD